MKNNIRKWSDNHSTFVGVTVLLLIFMLGIIFMLIYTGKDSVKKDAEIEAKINAFENMQLLQKKAFEKNQETAERNYINSLQGK
jgi:hypothetical protein